MLAPVSPQIKLSEFNPMYTLDSDDNLHVVYVRFKGKTPSAFPTVCVLGAVPTPFEETEYWGASFDVNLNEVTHVFHADAPQLLAAIARQVDHIPPFAVSAPASTTARASSLASASPVLTRSRALEEDAKEVGRVSSGRKKARGGS